MVRLVFDSSSGKCQAKRQWIEKRPIDKLSIKGFKSLQNVELELGQLNVLIGPNGAGKSNFVSFFHMLREAGKRTFPIVDCKTGWSLAYPDVWSQTRRRRCRPRLQLAKAFTSLRLNIPTMIALSSQEILSQIVDGRPETIINILPQAGGRWSLSACMSRASRNGGFGS